MNLAITNLSIIVRGQMKRTYKTAEDQLERRRKKDNTYESCKIDMVDYSSTGESVESDVNVTISAQVYLYLNVFL